jgi:hypothetical protein
MKRNRVVVAVLALTLLVLTLPLTSQAAESVRYRFRGAFASASFFADDGCVASYIDVSASDGRVQAAPGHPEVQSGANLSLYQYDYCAGTTLLAGYGFAALDADAFQIDRLTSATLHTTIAVDDWVSGASIPVEVNLAWSGTGATVRESNQYHSRSPDFTYNVRYTATSRAATAAGAVTLGGVNLTPAPAGWAILTKNADAAVWVSH